MHAPRRFYADFICLRHVGRVRHCRTAAVQRMATTSTRSTRSMTRSEWSGGRGPPQETKAWVQVTVRNTRRTRGRVENRGETDGEGRSEGVVVSAMGERSHANMRKGQIAKRKGDSTVRGPARKSRASRVKRLPLTCTSAEPKTLNAAPAATAHRGHRRADLRADGRKDGTWDCRLGRHSSRRARRGAWATTSLLRPRRRASDARLR